MSTATPSPNTAPLDYRGSSLPDGEPLLEVNNLRTWFPIRRGVFGNGY